MFITIFWVLSVVCVMLFMYTRTAVPVVADAKFHMFQQKYLLVYCLAMGKIMEIHSKTKFYL